MSKGQHNSGLYQFRKSRQTVERHLSAVTGDAGCKIEFHSSRLVNHETRFKESPLIMDEEWVDPMARQLTTDGCYRCSSTKCRSYHMHAAYERFRLHHFLNLCMLSAESFSIRLSIFASLLRPKRCQLHTFSSFLRRTGLFELKSAHWTMMPLGLGHICGCCASVKILQVSQLDVIRRPFFSLLFLSQKTSS